MPDLIARFAASHFTLNSISAQRQEQVLFALRNYEGGLDKPIAEATDADLRAHLVKLLEQGLKPSTVNWRLRMITPFYRWCWQERLIDADQLMRIREVKAPRGYSNGVPRPYSRKELRKMWAELDTKFPRLPEPRRLSAGRLDGRHPLMRWRKGTCRFLPKLKRHAMRLQLEAIIELALVCGLRLGEIYRLSIDDVHWDNKYIVVHGKRIDQNDKVREVPYPESTRAAVRAWLRMRGYMGATHDVLWCSVTGPDPSARLPWARMRRILHSFGDWSMHRLRHTCATERLRAGMEIEKLQRLLGHADIAMTLRYAKVVGGDVHKAAERTERDFQRAIRAAA